MGVPGLGPLQGEQGGGGRGLEPCTGTRGSLWVHPGTPKHPWGPHGPKGHPRDPPRGDLGRAAKDPGGPRRSLGDTNGTGGGTGEPRAKAFTHGGGRGNGSFTGGGLRALEEPVHHEAPVLAAAAPAAGVGPRTRAQDPIAADALRSREAASGQGLRVLGDPRGSWRSRGSHPLAHPPGSARRRTAPRSRGRSGCHPAPGRRCSRNCAPRPGS